MLNKIKIAERHSTSINKNILGFVIFFCVVTFFIFVIEKRYTDNRTKYFSGSNTENFQNEPPYDEFINEETEFKNIKGVENQKTTQIAQDHQSNDNFSPVSKTIPQNLKNTTPNNVSRYEVSKAVPQNYKNPYDGSMYDETLRRLHRVIDGKKCVNVTEMKYILYWDTFYGNEGMNLGLGSKIFENCPVKTCFTTHNRTFMKEEDFDAIVFHGGRWSAAESGVPDQSKRKAKQKYIFYSVESPFNTYFEQSYRLNFYNWTMNYRRDSDIHFPYRMIYLKEKNEYKIPTVEEVKNKKKMAMWMVSNCNTAGTERRIKYVEELKKYLEVDIYGTCGPLRCENTSVCRDLMEKNYYFYLGFENSQGQDYVTEKTFDTLRYNVIPVVMGNANYDNIVPKHSVIDIKDFSNPKLLAQYLISLKNNYTEYTSYFEWKKKYVISDKTEYAACQLCEMLHRPLEYSSYEDIQEWYHGFLSYLKK